MRVFEVIQQCPEVVCNHSRQTSCCLAWTTSNSLRICAPPKRTSRPARAPSLQMGLGLCGLVADGSEHAMPPLSVVSLVSREHLPVLAVLTHLHQRESPGGLAISCSTMWCRRFLLCAFDASSGLCVLTLNNSDNLPSEKSRLANFALWMLPTRASLKGSNRVNKRNNFHHRSRRWSFSCSASSTANRKALRHGPRKKQKLLRHRLHDHNSPDEFCVQIDLIQPHQSGANCWGHKGIQH